MMFCHSPSLLFTLTTSSHCPAPAESDKRRVVFAEDTKGGGRGATSEGDSEMGAEASGANNGLEGSEEPLPEGRQSPDSAAVRAAGRGGGTMDD